MRLSLEEFSTVTAAIHTAAAYPERWPEAVSSVARLASPAASAGEDWGWQKVLASLDRLGVTAFVVNGGGMVHHMNASAESLLAREDSISVGNSRLRLSDPALDSTFEAALRKATRTPYRSSLFPFRSTSNDVCEVNVSPLHHDGEGEGLTVTALALVVIARPRPDAEGICRRVRRLYGLTDAEARVMAAVTLGETVEQIASAHGVRVSTVRAQVRSIFEKTGVHRQTDLVRLALSGASYIARPER